MTIIYGASDDLFEIEGDINDEFDCYDTLVKFTCSDGTKGTAKYDGCWLLNIEKEGSLFLSLIPISGDDGKRGATKYPAYSQLLIFAGGLAWINVNGRKFIKP